MEFSNNILPKEASYYTLNNAVIVGGVLNIFTGGGSVKYEIMEKDIVTLTDYFRVVLMLDKAANNYTPDIQVKLQVVALDDTHCSVEIYPTKLNNNIFLQDVQLLTGKYKSFTFEVISRQAVTISLWELCPQMETDITTIIEGVEQSLPHVLYDYNTWTLQISEEEQTIGMITCNLLGNTDVNGHFSLDFYASEACNVHLRFKDNGITELYSPMTFTANAGHNTIGIPHAYLERLVGVHTFLVTCQCTSGVISIYPRGLLYTIDAGYLAERLIDAGMDIKDIAVKQTKADSRPEEVWAVGIDAGEILVKSRPYSIDANVAWTPKYSMGRGLNAAIEFDGQWVLRHNALTYTIETDDEPFVFIIELDKTLVVYKGHDLTTRTVLDNNVSCLSVVRGYKSTSYVEQDQGLVCAYIKDGQGYYIQYAYLKSAQDYVWNTPVLIESIVGATEIHISRLNDYRLSIVGSSPKANMWLITDRTYVNQAVPPEIFSTEASVDYVLTSMTPIGLLTTGEPVVFDNPNDPQKFFSIAYDANLRLLSDVDLKDTLEVTVNKKAVGFDCRIAENVLYIDLHEEATWTRESAATIVISTKNDSRKLILETSKQGHGIPITSETFTWLIERPMLTFNAYASESCAISGTVKESSLMPRGLVETKQVPIDITDFKGKLEANLRAVPLVKTTVACDDTATLQASIAGTCKTALVGEKPI